MQQDAGIETLGTTVRRHAHATPEKIAIEVADTRLSYAALDRLADRAVVALRQGAVNGGDVVAVAGRASIPYVVLMIAAARANVVLAPLPTSATPQAAAAMLADTGARHLFTDIPVDGSAAAEQRGLVVHNLSAAAFDRWLGAHGSVEQAQVPVTTLDPTSIIYSSGTTGVPKGIVQPHGYRSTMLSNAALRGYHASAVTMLATPLYSNTTLSAFIQTIGAGGTVVLMPKFDAGAWLATAERTGATHAMLVPVMCQRLLDHPDFAATDLSRFEMKFCTSAPFAAKLKREMLERWPGGLTEFYGMTEGGATFILRAHEHPDKLHTVGRLAPGSEVRILDADDRDVAPGVSGEIVGRSPGMMIGYHGRPAETAESRWTAPDGSTWQRTGDIGWLDDDGFLTIVDRKKDMIISGGFNVFPSDIEGALADHPAVAEVSVVGVPSTVWGETPVAFVVAAIPVSADTLKAWANARLGKMQRVADVVLIDALPRNPLGKVMKGALCDTYVA